MGDAQDKNWARHKNVIYRYLHQENGSSIELDHNNFLFILLDFHTNYGQEILLQCEAL